MTAVAEYFISIGNKSKLCLIASIAGLIFNLYLKDLVPNENVETKPEETDEPEAEDDLLDIPDNELGAVVEFDEDELDEAQTEADVKNITTKHQITIEELKREVLGSVRKRFYYKILLTSLFTQVSSFKIRPS